MTASRMRTIEFSACDASAPLFFGTRPRPDCAPDELLIEVHAAGVNHADIAQRAGRYPLKEGMSDILGLEVAGVVANVGAGVTQWRQGDQVCALLSGGGYAEYVAVPAEQCLAIPDGLTFAEAAALPEAFATVWRNVFEKAKLQPGEAILVHGGSSGVGMAAIQCAAALGARVYCTAGSAEKCTACLQEGATQAINYKAEEFESVIAGAGRQRVDVILDMVGGDYFARNMRLLAHGGRMVYIASLGGREVPLDLVVMMRKRLSLFGSVLRPLLSADKGRILRAMSAFVWPLLERRTFRPRIHQVFPAEAAEQAHAVLKTHGHIGKLVLEFR